MWKCPLYRQIWKCPLPVEDGHWSLHARLTLQKGDSPLTTCDLYKKMSSLWPNLKNSNIVPLCKGFFALLFNTVKEMQKLWSLRLLNLKLGILRFSCWTKDFHPSKQKLLHAQVWIQIMNLPQEHWRPTFLFEITSSLGTPLFPLMNPQKNRLFVHYARVLVDICLYVGIVFEKYPLYCKNCGVIGPSIQKCKRLATDQVEVNKTAMKLLRMLR